MALAMRAWGIDRERKGKKAMVMCDVFSDAVSLLHVSMSIYIQNLTGSVMKCLFLSDQLRVSSENETYTLLLSWLHQSREMRAVGSDRHGQAFMYLAHYHRYLHMDQDYLGNVVARCRLMSQFGFLSRIMQRALIHRTPYIAMINEMGIHTGPSDRGPPKQLLERDYPSWHFTTDIKISNLRTCFQETGNYVQPLGLVGGYPIYLRLQRRGGPLPPTQLQQQQQPNAGMYPQTRQQQQDDQINVLFGALFPFAGSDDIADLPAGIPVQVTFQITCLATNGGNGSNGPAYQRPIKIGAERVFKKYLVNGQNHCQENHFEGFTFEDLMRRMGCENTQQGEGAEGPDGEENDKWTFNGSFKLL